MCLGLDEYWRWLLQEKNNPWNFLIQEDVDSREIRWDNADLVTHVLPTKEQH